MTEAILPGATLGVLGSGQLARMFAVEARRMGYRVAVYDPASEGPVLPIVDVAHTAPFDDLDRVAEFAKSVAAVTTEFENVPFETAAEAERWAPVRPSAEALAVAQNRLLEKRTISGFGIPVAPFEALETEADLEALRAKRPWVPSILKTARSGYDGKGQVRVEKAEDIADAWERIGRAGAVLESVVPFEAELSVLGVRRADGEVVLYDAILNEHARHILDVSVTPSGLVGALETRAQEMTRAILEGLDYVGVLCVEMFLAGDELVVNEIAPRPHNSGHLTIEGHSCSQFEQQVRAMCGLPLGSPKRRVPAIAMTNLLGDLWQDGEPEWERALAIPDASLHLYGKAEARPKRKMGHITALGDSPDQARARALEARESLGKGAGEAEARSSGAVGCAKPSHEASLSLSSDERR